MSVKKNVSNMKTMTNQVKSRGVQFCPLCHRQMIMRLDGSRVCAWCDYQDDLCYSADLEDGIVDWRESIEGDKKFEVLEQP